MAAKASKPVLVRVTERAGIAAALKVSGVDVGVEAVVLVGGAGGMDDAETDALAEVLRFAVVPIVLRRGATVIDGGTDSGVMRSVGRSVARRFRGVVPARGCRGGGHRHGARGGYFAG